MILVFDTETTGLPPRRASITDPAYPRIIELAMLLLEEDGTEAGVANFVIKPDGWDVPAEISGITGIDTAMAKRTGIPVRVAVAAFTNFRRVAETCVGHNVEFDLGMVRSELHRMDADPYVLVPERGAVCTAILGEPICQLPPSQRMIDTGFGDKFKKPNLTELYRYLFDESLTGAHRALADVRATARCYLELRRRGACPNGSL